MVKKKSLACVGRYSTNILAGVTFHDGEAVFHEINARSIVLILQLVKQLNGKIMVAKYAKLFPTIAAIIGRAFMPNSTFELKKRG